MAKLQTTSFAEKSFFLTLPKNSTTKSKLLTKSVKKIDGRNRELVEQEKVLWAGKVEDAELRPESSGVATRRCMEKIALWCRSCKCVRPFWKGRTHGDLELIENSRCPYEGGRNG